VKGALKIDYEGWKMKEKMKAPIEHIELNAATYRGAFFTPTLINFFYGKNGTGKSTIARAIANGVGIEWGIGQSPENYDVLVYDDDFRTANLQNYENLAGVFTISEQNISVQNQISEKRGELTVQQNLHKTSGEEINKIKAELEALRNTFQNDIWEKSRNIREGFEKTQDGRKQKRTFADAVISVSKTPVKGKADEKEMRELYDTAFDASSRTYNMLVFPTDQLPLSALLSKVIVNSANTPFADFMKQINASNWVRQGHERYHQLSQNQCPYCQQKLPEDFEAQLAACFDSAYEDNLTQLKTYKQNYEAIADRIIKALQNNLADPFPKFDYGEYKDKLTILVKTVEENGRAISDKINDPTIAVELQDTSVLLNDLSVIIEIVNQQIKKNNDVVNAKQQKQNECKKIVWGHIAFLLDADVSSYLDSKSRLEKDLKATEKTNSDADKATRMIQSEIATLNRQTINTSAAVDSINLLLRDSGFQGFTLREKHNVPNVYEVVRENGSVADKLSEGEGNFIAFLYFNELVKGTLSSDGTMRSKIVVIDDPVSSMDSSTFFIVSALVREMVEVCHNNAEYLANTGRGDYIKQIFVLTHNTYFHREITYNQAGQYHFVSFYLVEKTDNSSNVRLCTRRKSEAPTVLENYDPVLNSYAALWSEYKEVSSEIPLVNVVRRILEYYFLQLCGYEGTDLRDRILVTNKEKFIEVLEDGTSDITKYQVASSLLSYIASSEVNVISDGLNYVSGSMCVDQCRETFEMIFRLMGQGQHYEMMMNIK
jgi:wobble nucleotide-excising tRNase